MKKIVLSLLIMVAAFTANAQIYVGGSFSWTRNDVEDSNQFSIAPEVGYNFNKQWAVGVELEYIHKKQPYEKANGFSIAPYARYTFFEKSIVRLFLDGGVGFSTMKWKYEDNDNGFEIGIKPGIAVVLSDHWSLEAKYGFLGYRDKYTPAGGNANVSGLDFNPNSLSFGIKYEF